MRSSQLLVLIFLATFCGAGNGRAFAQDRQPSGENQKPPFTVQDSSEAKTPANKQSSDEEKDKKKRKHLLPGAIVAAPLPVSSPAIGSGVIPVLGYIFPISAHDKISPPSVVGGAGLITNNGSRGFGLGTELYFKEDTYRITAGYVHGNLNYDIYGLGDMRGEAPKLPLTQNGDLFFGEFLRRAWWDFFIGPRFWNGDSVVTIRSSSSGSVPPDQIPPDIGLHTTLRAIGFRLQRDMRPNRFYPTSGTLTDFTSDFFSQALGSKYTFQSYRLTFNQYTSLTKDQVLAFGSYFCATGGEPPFYGYCIYGAQNQLRGYTADRYFDRYMLASQLEYRLALPKRLGLVVFGGLGGVIPGGAQDLFRKSYFLPAGGTGLRFDLSKKYHVNLRADIAWGKDGHTFAVGVGEAF
jgi:Omp85 superfamily domain